MFRLLGLLGGLSVATDLGTGAPLEESLRRCLVAVRLARSAGASEAEVSDVLYTSLLQHLGCTAYSHESAHRWGDDIAPTRLAFRTDFSRPTDIWRTWVPGLAELSGTSRGRALVTTLRQGRSADAEGPPATCEVARDAAGLLGLPTAVQEALFHGLSMWNGKGYPAVRGEQIPLASRIMHVASTAVMFTLDDGPAAARTQVRHRGGTQLDPGLAQLFLDRSDDLLEGVDKVDAHRAVLAAEPDLPRMVDPAQLEEVARTLGHLVDLKSPSLHGHSAAVARLAAGATECLGLVDAVPTVRVAGHLHDLGRVAVSSRIWDKPGPLSATEIDQVRLHAYHSERIVARVPELDAVAALVGRHHERCDGSGYHRGLVTAQLSMPARVLAAADSYRNLVEARPHRTALPSAEAAARLRTDVEKGRLDADAVAAVLEVAGQGRRGRRARPAGLTERQVEVLRLVAVGMSNPEIAERLTISRRTAEHHVQDVYLKIGASTRAGAALFAMSQGLLDSGDLSESPSG